MKEKLTKTLTKGDLEVNWGFKEKLFVGSFFTPQIMSFLTGVGVALNEENGPVGLENMVYLSVPVIGGIVAALGTGVVAIPLGYASHSSPSDIIKPMAFMGGVYTATSCVALGLGYGIVKGIKYL
jgi:ABC-type Fe3+ transport system permease subunit